jgi:hypothetical protein
MKRFHIVIVALLAAIAAPAFATNVVVHIGDPGYYGRLDVGGYPHPRLVYAEPVVIERRVIVREPVYVRVPVYQARNWTRYCGRYNACNRPTYFVQDNWYQSVYAPQYRDRYGAGTTRQQQRLATREQQIANRADLDQQKATLKAQHDQQKASLKAQKEQQKLAEKNAKEQHKLAKKAEKEQKKLDKKA